MEGEKLERCDVLIRNGTVIDGSGGARYRADVAISGDRIAAVGDLATTAADVTIDAAGRIVAPGFIDAHTHDDRLALSDPGMTPKVSQGVTSVVVGNCGISLAPLVLDRHPPPPMDLLGDRDWYRFARFGDYLDTLDREPPAINLACLVGHSTLRAAAMDDLARPATADQIARMADTLDDALGAGAIGLSTGLAYPTAMAAPIDEVVALAERLAPAGAIYTTHMRDEGDRVVESIAETVETGRRAGVRVVISHHKCNGRQNWGRTRETLPQIAAAQRGQTLDLDVYPYIASSTSLLPDFIENSERVLVTWSTPHPDCTGRDLAEIAAEWGLTRDAAAERLMPAGAIYFSMDEQDLQRIIAFPRAMIGSDGLPHDEKPHPRLWGTFPRVLGHYCRDLGLLPLEEAVHRMTGVPAGVFGLAGRGTIAPGAFADVTVFDAETVIDRATFDDPIQPAAGIETVIVNGTIAWRNGTATGARTGRALRRDSSNLSVGADQMM